MVYIEHFVAQLWNVDPKILNSRKLLKSTAFDIAKDLKLTIVKTFVHKFEPHGLSLILVIAESHLAIHTWPELSYMNIDILSCSKETHLNKLEEKLKERFNNAKITCKKIEY